MILSRTRELGFSTSETARPEATEHQAERTRSSAVGSGPDSFALQVRVGGRVTEQAAHRDDLALVVERVRHYVVKNERWTRQSPDPFLRTVWQRGVELCIGQPIEIHACRGLGALLSRPQRLDCGIVCH
jgi:hypothetical protein